jgi:DNA-binding PadR family transcriptional regulator
LEKQGFIHIYLSKTKPPRKFVVITDQGKKYLEEVLPEEQDLFEQFFCEDLNE